MIKLKNLDNKIFLNNYKIYAVSINVIYYCIYFIRNNSNSINVKKKKR